MTLNWFKYRFLFSLFLLAVMLQVGLNSCTSEPVLEEETFNRLLNNENLQSRVLHQSVHYAVLLPENYNVTTDSFPVVYLLHGFGDNYTAWYKGGAIQFFADKLISDIVPMIFVMVDGYNSYYVNKYSGSFRYMDMITTEFVPEIDSLYRTKKKNTQRAVMGYSMGGYGALILPAMNPDIFGISVPLSMSFRTDDQYISESQDGWNYQWGSVFGGSGITGTGRFTDYFIEQSPFHFFDEPDISRFNNIRFQIHCGDDEESLHITSGELHNLMRRRDINHEYRVGNGGHSWDYWHSALSEALIFISCGFEETVYPENPEPVSIGETLPDGQYTLVTIPGTTLNTGIFLPPGYDTTKFPYPSIFFIHDNMGSDRADNAMQTLTLLNNKMLKGSLPKSMVIEIPGEEGEITGEIFNTIIEYVNQNFRLLPDKRSRIVIANGEAGAFACNFLSEFQESFNACFLYNARLPQSAQASEGIYYYVDVTDKADAYQENFNLFINIRETGNEYEYRVRQGAQNYQSFLNGLDASVRYMSKHLKS